MVHPARLPLSQRGDVILHCYQISIIEGRAKLRRALRRQPSPNAHLIGRRIAPGNIKLSVEQYAAVIEQGVYLRRWQEVREICWSLRCARRGLAELAAEYGQPELARFRRPLRVDDMWNRIEGARL